MTMLFVTGFHGTTLACANDILNTKTFMPSPGTHHWIGPGVYFWQDAPLRAWEWALYASRRDTARSPPAVIRAAISISHCFDLLDIGYERWIKQAYREMVEQEQTAQGWSGEPVPLRVQQVPSFRDAHGVKHHIGDRVEGARANYNYRDFDVIERVLFNIHTTTGQRFTSARGAFSEGQMLYPSSFLFDRSHVQVAVIEPEAMSDMRLEDSSILDSAYRARVLPR